MRIPKREREREREGGERQTDRQRETERCLLVYIDIVAKGYNPLKRSVFFDYFL